MIRKAKILLCQKVVKRPPGRFEAIPDDLTANEILEQARMAAKGAANRLKIYKSKSKMGFLRQKPDGSTSLKFLTGNSGITPGTENERPVELGTLIGKVKQGMFGDFNSFYYYSYNRKLRLMKNSQL